MVTDSKTREALKNELERRLDPNEVDSFMALADVYAAEHALLAVNKTLIKLAEVKNALYEN